MQCFTQESKYYIITGTGNNLAHNMASHGRLWQLSLKSSQVAQTVAAYPSVLSMKLLGVLLFISGNKHFIIRPPLILFLPNFLSVLILQSRVAFPSPALVIAYGPYTIIFLCFLLFNKIAGGAIQDRE